MSSSTRGGKNSNSIRLTNLEDGIAYVRVAEAMYRLQKQGGVEMEA